MKWIKVNNKITCTINQSDSDFATNLVSRYKVSSVAEMSAFVASIRPGFASLLNTFLNREPYTTGETKIDSLLEDTAHFMIYQESIMKVLSFLKLAMGETYGVIKSISKKKLKGEKVGIEDVEQFIEQSAIPPISNSIKAKLPTMTAAKR